MSSIIYRTSEIDYESFFFFFLYILYSISVVFPIRFPNHMYTIHSYILKIQKRENSLYLKENPTLLFPPNKVIDAIVEKKDTTWTSFTNPSTILFFFFSKRNKIYTQSCRIWHKYIKKGWQLNCCDVMMSHDYLLINIFFFFLSTLH